MKKFALIFLLFSGFLFAQSPDCIWPFSLIGTGPTVSIDNRQNGCTNWIVAYQSTGFSAISLLVESASGATGAGTFGSFSGSIVSPGVNPNTSTTQASTQLSGYVGWIRVNLTSATGSGTVRGVLYGRKQSFASNTTSGCGTFTGDLSGACPAGTVVGLESVPFCSGFTPLNNQVLDYSTVLTPNPCWSASLFAGDISGPPGAITVFNVNGTPYGASPAAHSVPVVGVYKVIPDCPSNALGFTQSTNAFVCNTIPAGGATANQNIRRPGAGFDGGGSAITSGKTVYFTWEIACTITGFDITVDTGTISFDVWKIATGTAIPTVTNSILTGGFLALTTGTALHSTSTGLFTSTAVAANDIWAIHVQTVSGATISSLVVPCTAS